MRDDSLYLSNKHLREIKNTSLQTSLLQGERLKNPTSLVVKGGRGVRESNSNESFPEMSNIKECIERIESYTCDGKEYFMQNPMIQDAVMII